MQRYRKIQAHTHTSTYIHTCMYIYIYIYIYIYVEAAVPAAVCRRGLCPRYPGWGGMPLGGK